MADEPTTQEQDLRAQFTEARLAGDHARLEAIGRQLYPDEPVENRMEREGSVWRDEFRAKLAEKYRTDFAKEDVARGTGTLNPRAMVAAVNLQLEKGLGYQSEHTRQALLSEREHWQRQVFEENTERAAATARAEQAAPPVAGYTAGAHPAPPPGRAWNAPALDAVAAQLVAREIAPADLSRWLARGAALAQGEPADAPALDAAVIADARFALQAFLPERMLRAQVEKFLEETGLGNDEQFIRELAARGAPLRQELEEARRDRYRLGTLNEGSQEHKDVAASINARFKRIYGGG
jgi:hypothetical protein